MDVVAFAGAIGMKGTFDSYRSRVRNLPEFGGEFPIATLADEIETPGDGQVRALVTLAGNPVSSAPNGRRLDQALPKLDAQIAVDLYVNETTRHADLILPPVSQLQRPYLHFVFSLFAVRHTAKASEPVLSRGPHDKTDAEITFGLARRLLDRRGGLWRAAGMGARVVEGRGLSWVADALLRLGPTDLTYRELSKAPHGIDLGPLEPVLPDRLQTADRKIHVAPQVYLDLVPRLAQAWRAGELAGDKLRLIGRRNLRSNNSWMHNVAPTAGAAACTLMMHPRDAAERGLANGDRAVLDSRTGGVEAVVEVTREVRPGVVSLPHGHGHDLPGVEMKQARCHGGVSVNDVTDDEFLDVLTGNAAYNGVPVEVRPVSEAAE
jgi:anaerobic selenocysteine-containing dehydrogenase